MPKSPITSLLILWISFCTVKAGELPPEKLLPGNTLATLVAPSYTRLASATENSPLSMLARDPAMKPLMDKFMARWRTDVLLKLEKQFGVQLTNYAGLAEGFVCLALLQASTETKDAPSFPFVFLMDSGSKSNALKTSLADLRKKWADAGRPIRPETLRGVEFSAVQIKDGEVAAALEKAFPSKGEPDEQKPAPGKEEAKDTQATEFLVGQSGSLLLIGNSSPELQKILAMQAGGSAEILADNPLFSAWRGQLFEGADYFAWANLKNGVDLMRKGIQAAQGGGRQAGASSQVLDALGLGALHALGFSSRSGKDGVMNEFRLASPENERTGVPKMLAFAAKDSSPPPFVPDDVLSFNRGRIDLAKTFEVLEETVVKAMPAAGGIIKMIMETAGKEKDPNFDLRKSLFGNLGDDYISYAKVPREPDLENINAPPSLHLIGGRDANQLATSLKTLTALIPAPGGKKDRELLGRKVFAMPLGEQGETLSYTASEGYLVATTDDAMLEEYLRSSEKKQKPLRDLPGLAADAEKVKGQSTGMFGYENDKATVQMQLEILKKESGSVANLVSAIPLASRLGWDENSKAFSDWVDLSLLPPFDKVSKYFHRSVYSMEFTPLGVEFRRYSPRPPELAK